MFLQSNKNRLGLGAIMVGYMGFFSFSLPIFSPSLMSPVAHGPPQPHGTTGDWTKPAAFGQLPRPIFTTSSVPRGHWGTGDGWPDQQRDRRLRGGWAAARRHHHCAQGRWLHCLFPKKVSSLPSLFLCALCLVIPICAV